MPASDFDFEFYSPVRALDGLRAEAERRLRKLAAGRRDMIGASVTVERPAHGETSFVYRARIVAYVKPENVAAVEKADSAEAALKAALSAVERQVRERRAMRRQSRRQPETS